MHAYPTVCSSPGRPDDNGHLVKGDEQVSSGKVYNTDNIA